MKFYCLALVSLFALSLVGCSKDEGIKPDESMAAQFEQAKKDGTAGTPPPSKSGMKKAGASNEPTKDGTDTKDSNTVKAD